MHVELAFVARAPGADEKAARFEPLEQRGEGRGVELKRRADLLHRHRRVLPQREHHQVLRVSQAHGFEKWPIDAQHRAIGDCERKAHLPVQREWITVHKFEAYTNG